MIPTSGVVGAMADGIERGDPSCSARETSHRIAKGVLPHSRPTPKLATSSSARPKPSKWRPDDGRHRFQGAAPDTTALKPASAAPAPMRPPISFSSWTWHRPAHQVRGDSIRWRPSAPRRLPVRIADSAPGEDDAGAERFVSICKRKKRKAMKFKNAAQATAILGESTRVEYDSS